jgi:hypothetical protein
MYIRKNTVDTHGDWWSNGFCLSGNTLSNSGVVVVTMVMIFMWDRKVLSNVNDENEGENVTRIDTTHRKGRREIMGEVQTIHTIVSEVLWLPPYSSNLNIPSGRRYIPITIGSAITDIIHWWELINQS